MHPSKTLILMPRTTKKDSMEVCLRGIESADSVESVRSKNSLCGFSPVTCGIYSKTGNTFQSCIVEQLESEHSIQSPSETSSRCHKNLSLSSKYSS